jgi:phosphatidylglycerol:prolipoprotein diacylglycerol transferase
MAGCCWGRPTDVPWAVTFSHPNTFATLRNVPLHPTQLYEAAGALAIFGYLQWRWKDRKYVGQIFFHSLVLYAVLRFIIELYRGDEYRGYVFNNLISYSQLVSLVILPFAIAGIVLYSRRRPTQS